jgi:ATP-dependent DNA helicase RecG
MNSSIDKIIKFFKLEAEKGYDNQAVVGGLSGILSTWESEARAQKVPQEIIQAVISRLNDYQRLSPTGRKDALIGLTNRINNWQNKSQSLDNKKEKPKSTEEKNASKNSPNPSANVTKGRRRNQPEKQKKQAIKGPYQSKKIEDGPRAALDASVRVLDGVGVKNAEKLAKLNIESLRNMLHHFPRRYDDYSEMLSINRIKVGDQISVLGVVHTIRAKNIHGGKSKIIEVLLSDGTGTLRVTWFNQPWLEKTFKKNMTIVVSGKVDQYLGKMVITNPDYEMVDSKNLHTSRIVPIYPLTADITQKWLRNQMDKVVNYWSVRVKDPVPNSVVKNSKLMELPDALLQIHFPDSQKLLEEAKNRLAFDDVFYLQLGILQHKKNWDAKTGKVISVEQAWLEEQFNQLPYQLTNAQKKCVETIKGDFSAGRPMNRMIQGDVGSGKTVVSVFASQMVLNQKGQVAILAPTGILAEQHYKTFQQLLPETNIRLLVGATPDSEKAEIKNALAEGKVSLIVGTHALLEPDVTFENLELIVIDEQHRFGVGQRSTLRSKGNNPHLLVMTATPIPRSLALTIFGDLDISTIDELPPGRKTIETQIYFPRERERAYQLIRKQISLGHQVFMVYPRIEEDDLNEGISAIEAHKQLQEEIFQKYKVGLLHGKMRNVEKDEVMQSFREGEIDILVSTSVIEVGVDIPNASVMVIVGANRFGLAQLHQFRGRVGRGGSQAYCMLMPDISENVENERLKVMLSTSDGFELAEHDLKHRGPGQFLGTNQSGFSGFPFATLTNIKLIEMARNEAKSIIDQDIELTLPEHQLLKSTLSVMWQSGEGDIS